MYMPSEGPWLVNKHLTVNCNTFKMVNSKIHVHIHNVLKFSLTFLRAGEKPSPTRKNGDMGMPTTCRTADEYVTLEGGFSHFNKFADM